MLLIVSNDVLKMWLPVYHRGWSGHASSRQHVDRAGVPPDSHTTGLDCMTYPLLPLACCCCNCFLMLCRRLQVHGGTMIPETSLQSSTPALAAAPVPAQCSYWEAWQQARSLGFQFSPHFPVPYELTLASQLRSLSASERTAETPLPLKATPQKSSWK
jgi:hypothetical protein